MSEIKNYIILSFKGENKEVKLPSNFDELKKIFFENFNEDSSKIFKFFYFKDDEDFSLTKENFSEEIEKIRNLDNQIYVHETEEEDEAMKQVVNFSKQFSKKNDKELMRQNALKNVDYSNNIENNDENLIEKLEDGNNNRNDFAKKMSYFDNKYYNINNSLRAKSFEVLKESENSSIEQKEKEKEIIEVNKKELNNDLLKALEEENNKNKILENKLKELANILQNEKKEKIELINIKKDLELKYQSLEKKIQ